jgi:ABC-type Fe3+/spermidine/putrescine transport system ATPase subunit
LEQLAAIGPSALDVGPRAPRSTTEPVLQLRAVSKRFSSRPVVDSVDLTVRRGELFTLLGPSGCGKTTTLRMVAGLERPDAGEIVLRGKVVASPIAGRFEPPEKRNLGMVFQSYAIWPHMTVAENVAYPLEVRGQPRAVIRRRVAEVLEQVGLAGLEARPATQLSGGQQQRLALCRALVYEPDLILLDEPFSNLDARLREQMRVEVKLLQQRLNVTVLFVTHDQLEALSLSDTIAVMNLGRVEQVASPRSLYETPSSPFVRDFVGQNLLLSGRVRDVLSPSRARVTIDGLPQHTVYTGRIAPGWIPSVADPVKVAIRPEEVEVLSSGACEGQGVVPARTQAAVFLGDRYQLSVVLPNGVHLQLQAPRTATDWSSDQPVGVYLPPEGVTLWPA